MASAKRILIISYEFPPNVGGIGNHAYNLAKSLSNEGYSVTVMADIMDVSREKLNDFTAKQNFRLHWIRRKKIVLLSYIHRIFSAVTLSSKADKIICTGKFPLWLGLIIRSLSFKKELVAVVHGSELDLKSSLPRRLTFFALSKFNKIVAVSKYTQSHLPASLSPSIKKRVIPNGINIEEFCQADNNSRGENCGNPALITIGSVTERKGQENVINALPELLSVYPDTKYHVIGKPVITEALTQKAESLEVGKAVQFYGAIDRREMLSKLSNANVKFMLSNHTADGDFEGYGISILEANAFGVPAIGSKDSGIADAIEHEKTGLLVNPYNSREVTSAVKTIMDNYSHFSENAKAWAVQHDWKKVVKEYVAVLEA